MYQNDITTNTHNTNITSKKYSIHSHEILKKVVYNVDCMFTNRTVIHDNEQQIVRSRVIYYVPNKHTRANYVSE